MDALILEKASRDIRKEKNMPRTYLKMSSPYIGDNYVDDGDCTSLLDDLQAIMNG